MGDYKLKCRVCNRQFPSYLGALETRNGSTCPRCHAKANPDWVAALNWHTAGGILATPPVGDVEPFPAATDLFPLADALLKAGGP